MTKSHTDEPDDEPDEAGIIERQGWSDASVLTRYRDFVAEKGLDDEFLAFLRERAAEENAVAGAGTEHLSGPTFFARMAPEDAPGEVNDPFDTEAEARAHPQRWAELARLDHYGNDAWVDQDDEEEAE